MAALNEPSTLDELGIGPVRNAFSDALFPGTSTVQTRARYFLFVPWILQIAATAKPADRERRARDLQVRLCQELQRTEGAGKGVIGLRAGAGLRRIPSSIYWGGLLSWGIWRAQESPEPVIDSAHSGADHQAPREGSEADTDILPAPQAWAGLPDSPKDFPQGVNFDLTAEEARILCERVELTQPRSYTAHLLQHSDAEGMKSARAPWNCPAADSTSGLVAALLNDARNLSFVHSGATILYNRILAEANEDAERCDKFGKELGRWATDLNSRRGELAAWDRSAMWSRLLKIRPNIRPATIAFINAWHELAVDSGEPVQSRQAIDLLRERELVLKGRRARLTYPEARRRHRGYGDWGRMTYRWGTARRILLDIVSALDR